MTKKASSSGTAGFKQWTRPHSDSNVAVFVCLVNRMFCNNRHLSFFHIIILYRFFIFLSISGTSSRTEEALRTGVWPSCPTLFVSLARQCMWAVYACCGVRCRDLLDHLAVTHALTHTHTRTLTHTQEKPRAASPRGWPSRREKASAALAWPGLVVGAALGKDS